VGPDERKAMQVFKRYIKQLPQGQGDGILVNGTNTQGDIAYARVS
jgi:hypothetical protein